VQINLQRRDVRRCEQTGQYREASSCGAAESFSGFSFFALDSSLRGDSKETDAPGFGWTRRVSG